MSATAKACPSVPEAEVLQVGKYPFNVTLVLVGWFGIKDISVSALHKLDRGEFLVHRDY